jgi:hypothetical protein
VNWEKDENRKNRNYRIDKKEGRNKKRELLGR